MSESTGGMLADSAETFQCEEPDQLLSEAANGSTTAFGYDGDGNLTALTGLSTNT
jgi:RHS Repeat